MTTIINTQPSTTEDSPTGIVIGIILVALLVILLVTFGIPYLRNQPSAQTQNVPDGPTTINVTVPSIPSTDNTVKTK
jgi:hypothetical protein